MKTSKRIISIILILSLLIGMVPTSVSAANASASVDSGITTVEGTNSFGMLLSEAIQDQQADREESYSGGYNVIGLTVENGVATVEYDTLEKAVLVVSLYTEDGLQLLVSGNTVVQPEESKVEVTLEGEIPEYFMASAYLLDTYDYSPLCASYDTPMYTKEMQELLASTTDDYDSDKLLNLDNDKNTNFAVYADTTKVLNYVAGVNTVISADDETATYVIGNADTNITGLKTGDVLAYAYGENQILIVKVATINADGSTVTINGADLEMEEVFSHVKVEGNGGTEDFTVDEATGDDDITYIGMVSDDVSTMSYRDPYAVDPIGDYTGKLSLGFELEKESGSIKYSGSLALNLKVDFSYYVSTSRQFVELEIDTETKLAFKISGKAELAKSLPSLNFSPIPAVSVGFKPELVLRFTAEVEFSLSVGNKTGFSYENGKGVQDLSTSPKVEMDLNVEGKIFFGLDLGPAVWVLGGKIAEIKFSALAGIELKAEMGGTNFDDYQLVGGTEIKDSIHTCESCLEISISAKKEFSLKLKFLNLSFLKLEFKLTDKVFELGECYYSFDQHDFGWGACPNKSYRVTVYVQNAQGYDAFGIDVIAGWAEKLTEIPLGRTNSNGVVVDYLQAGTYTFMATVDGNNLGKAVKVEDACKVVLDEKTVGSPSSFLSNAVNPDLIADYGSVIASGECGANGSNVVWSLFSSGTLQISGRGDMEDYYYFSGQPWCSYESQIKKVIIKENITSIGDCAFEFCDQLTSVSIPSSITSINEDAFAYCTSLEEVTIPAGVNNISSSAFLCCENLKGFTVDERNPHLTSDTQGIIYNKSKSEIVLVPNGLEGSVVIPNGVTFISYEAFAHCTKLTDVTLPNSVRTIEANAFEGCANLKTINIPENVSSIGDLPFKYCENLININVHKDNAEYSSDAQGILYDKNKRVLLEAPGGITGNVEIPVGVQRIDFGAFESCYNLTSVSIPSTVSYIGDDAFNSCWNLSTVSIHDGVTYIGESAFYNNYVLEDIKIPASVTVIDDYTFAGCRKLENIEIPAGVTSIGLSAFRGCKLTHITIPKSVTNIEQWAFEDCVSLKKIVFEGNAPQFGADIFDAFVAWIVAEAYYPANNTTWTSNVMQDYGGAITWVSYVLDGNGEMIIDTSRAMVTDALDEVRDDSEAATEDANYGILMRSIWGGEYETEVTDTYTLKKASFTELVPGEQYVLLALVSIEVEDILTPDNLLYIDQKVATEDGTLAFTYVQRETTDTSFVMACGASHNDLTDATITFPTMTTAEEAKAVHPIVVYNGETLTEGVDYVVVGMVDYMTAGTYTCYVRGIYNYTGLVPCTYKVANYMPGDYNGDGKVNFSDYSKVLAIAKGNAPKPEEDILARIDINSDGKINFADYSKVLAIAKRVTITPPA